MNKQLKIKSKSMKKNKRREKKVISRNVKKLFREAVKSAKHVIATQKPQLFEDAAKIATNAAAAAIKLEKKIPKKKTFSMDCPESFQFQN